MRLTTAPPSLLGVTVLSAADLLQLLQAGDGRLNEFRLLPVSLQRRHQGAAALVGGVQGLLQRQCFGEQGAEADTLVAFLWRNGLVRLAGVVVFVTVAVAGQGQ